MSTRYLPTYEGCKGAKAYLILIDKYTDFIANSQSTDGYSLVEWANVEYDKRNGTKLCTTSRPATDS